MRDRASGAEGAARGPVAARPAEKKAPAVAREAPEPLKNARPSEPGAATDERFEVARQVAALERSIELYQMFLERAGDDPRYAEAVQRSQGRIEDARLTICFLLEKPCESGSDGK